MKDNRLGCLSSSAILAIGLTLLGLTAAILFSGGGMFSAGALSAKAGASLAGVHSHAEIENDCARCHPAPWDADTLNNRCIQCHTDIVNQLANPTSAHFLMMNRTMLTCRDCHTEHHGSTASLTDISLHKFPHEASGFSLASHRLRQDGQVFICADCHGKDNFRFDQNFCGSCHKQIDSSFMASHIQVYGADCLGCHDGKESLGKNFDHGLATFKLEGKHAGLGCEKCHTAARRAADFKSQAADCIVCHLKDDTHKGGLGKQCGVCHQPTGWKPVVFDHNIAAFKLIGAHNGVACEKCHLDNVFVGTPSDCYSCHKKDDHHNGHLGQKCDACHSTIAWKPASFDHNLSVFKLTGAHASAACEKCHANNVFQGTPTDCNSCHQKDDNHKGSLGPNCSTCHSTSAWKPASFDHNLAIFKLTGAHNSATCEKCHANNVFKGTPTDCNACHQKDDKHNGSLGSSCSTCHSTSAWKPASFDHNLAIFKLTGAHSAVACEKCHANNVFKGTPTDCNSCHQKDDNHHGSLGTNCSTCHSTTAWKPASFDHNLAIFKLTGAHTGVTCEKCHANNVFKGTPSDCYSCHKKDDNHNGAFGTNCGSCHATSAWSPASFDHNLSTFKLTGAHTSVVCGKCHVNNVFKGTPSDCYSCHKKDDNHAGAFGTNCGSCHSTNSWGSATFDHNLSSFKLTGAHASVDCLKCHVNNVFKGTPQVCSSCHAEPAFHQGLFAGQACSDCHNTSGWSPAKFNLAHPQPTNGGDAGSGVNHGHAACRDCHSVNLMTAICTKCHNSNNPGD